MPAPGTLATGFDSNFPGQAPEWAAYLAELAAGLHIDDPPPIEPIRVVGEDYSDVQDQCIADAGFAFGPDGVIDLPNDQTAAFNLAIYTCSAQYPLDAKYLKPLTRDQYRKIYEYLKNEAIPCLAALGYSVAPLPSEDTYLETIGTPDQYTTSGELGKLGLSPGEVEVAIGSCPEAPPAAVLLAE